MTPPKTTEELLALAPAKLCHELLSAWGVHRLDEIELEGRYSLHGSGGYGFFQQLKGITPASLVLPHDQGIVNRAFAPPFLRDEKDQPLVSNRVYRLKVKLSPPDKRKAPFDLIASAAGQLDGEFAPLPEKKPAYVTHNSPRPIIKIQAAAPQVPARPNKPIAQQPAKRAPQATTQHPLPVATAQRRQEVDAILQKRLQLLQLEWGAETLIGLMDQVAARLATSPERMIWELLQNADDMPSQRGEEPRVVFELLQSHFLFLHNGRPFAYRDVDAISDATRGGKVEADNMTGHKGIGFKAVFPISKAVFIRSGGYSFRFKQENAKEYWQLLPRWTTEQELGELAPELAASSFLRNSNDFSVSVALQTTVETVADYQRLLPRVFENTAFLLFLRHVRSLTLRGHHLAPLVAIRRDDSRRHQVDLAAGTHHQLWRRDTYDVSLSEQAHAAAGKTNLPPAVKNAVTLPVVFAAPIRGERIQPVKPERSFLYCYLPTTDDHYRFPALVNADFLTDPSRESAYPAEAWNHFLFEEIGKLFPRWLGDIIGQESQWIDSIYNLLPVPFRDPDENPNKAAFNRGILAAAPTTAFLLTAANQPVCPPETVLDEASLADVLPTLYDRLRGARHLLHPAATAALRPHRKWLQLATVNFEDVLGEIKQKNELTYSVADAVRLLQRLATGKSGIEASELQAIPWLFDQRGVRCAPNEPGLYGFRVGKVDEYRTFPYPLRWLHDDIQQALRDADTGSWFRDNVKLRELTRREAVERVLKAEIERKTSLWTADESQRVANYLRQLPEAELDWLDKAARQKMPVLRSDGQLSSLGTCYLGAPYAPEQLFDELNTAIGGGLPLVSPTYCVSPADATSWTAFWRRAGAATADPAALIPEKLKPLLAANPGPAVSARLVLFLLELFNKKKLDVSPSWLPRAQSKKLFILTSRGGWAELGKCYLPDHYKPEHSLEPIDKLLGGNRFDFVSSNYSLLPSVLPALVDGATNWRKFWETVGVEAKTPNGVIKDEVLPLVVAGTLSAPQQDAVLQEVFLAWRTSGGSTFGNDDWKKLRNIKLGTVAGARLRADEVILPPSLCAATRLAQEIIGADYLARCYPSLLAERYVQQMKLTADFLALIGVQEPDEEDALTEMLAGLADAPPTIMPLADSVKLVRQLFQLARTAKLTDQHRDALRRLPLYQLDNVPVPASGCYLSSLYQPKLDLQAEISAPGKRRFLSEAYLPERTTETEIKQWRKFLTDWLGVRQEFEPQWFKSISRPEAEREPILLPYLRWVDAANAHEASFAATKNTLVLRDIVAVNHLDLVTNETSSAALAKALSSAWDGKPASFPVADCVANEKNYLIAPLLGLPCLTAVAGGQTGQYTAGVVLTSRLLGKAPATAIIAVHRFGSAELEEYLGLRINLSGDEAVAYFWEQVAPMARQEAAPDTLPKLFKELCRHFEGKDAPALEQADHWRQTVRLPAADHSWQPIHRLHWLDPATGRFYSSDRSDLLLRELFNDAPDGWDHLCAELGIEVLDESDFTENESRGTRLPDVPVSQHSGWPQTWTVIGHHFHGNQADKHIARWQKQLGKLRFSPGGATYWISEKLPGYKQIVETRTQIHGTTFRFAGDLWDWKNCNHLAQFLDEQLGLELLDPKIIIDLLVAKPYQLASKVAEYGWSLPPELVPHVAPVTALLPGPVDEPIPAPKVEAPTAPAPIPVTSLPEDDEDSADDEDEPMWRSDAFTRADLPKETQKRINEEARSRARKWLETAGYTQSSIEAADWQKPYAVFGPFYKIGDPQRKEYEHYVVVKSYRKKMLFLAPNEWQALARPNRVLLLCGQKQVTAIRSLDELIAQNPNVLVRLSTSEYSAERLTRIAEAATYSGSFKFILNSVSNDAFDFGLNYIDSRDTPLEEQPAGINLF